METEIQENSNTVKFISSAEELQYSSINKMTMVTTFKNHFNNFGFSTYILLQRRTGGGRSESIASGERTQRDGYNGECFHSWVYKLLRESSL